MNIGGVIETQSWKDKADAILLSWQPGQEAGNAVAEILSGNTNPSGKLAQTFPQKYEDVPSAKSFPGIPAENPLNSFHNEGIYVGYRFYDTFKIPVSYAFGYGLSYSEFSFSNLKIENNEGNQTLTLSFAITNSGKKSGKEVGQIYISAPKQKLKKPEQELKAFVKTEDLQPGKSQNFAVTIPYEDLASFQSETSAWILENGTYEARIGNSSASILQKEYFEIEKELTISKVGNLMKPDAKINEIQ